jgi:hypothetical protein
MIFRLNYPLATHQGIAKIQQTHDIIRRGAMLFILNQALVPEQILWDG